MNVPNPPYGLNNLMLDYFNQKEKIKRQYMSCAEYKIMLANLDSEISVRKQVLKDRDRRIAQKRMLDQIIARNAIFAPFAYGLGPFFPPSRI
jgi:hypothetical protein